MEQCLMNPVTRIEIPTRSCWSLRAKVSASIIGCQKLTLLSLTRRSGTLWSCEKTSRSIGLSPNPRIIPKERPAMAMAIFKRLVTINADMTYAKSESPSSNQKD